MSHIRWVGIGACVCLWSAAAYAQDFGNPGQVVIGAERLTGVYSDHLKSTITQATTDGNGNPASLKTETSMDTTTIAFLGVPSTLGDPGVYWPAATPRLALDVFVAPGLSLGGSFIYLQRSGSSEVTATPSTATTNDKYDLPTGSTLLFSPRVGYAAQLSPSFAIWPRAGITYANYRMTEKDTNSTTGAVTTYKVSADFTDVSLEVMAVAVAVQHFAVLVGPYLDLPLGGSSKVTTNGVASPNSPKLKYWSVGLSLGVAGYF